MVNNVKRANGQFYTQKNPFQLKPFRDWAKKAKTIKYSILEPFAGENNLIKFLIKEGLCKHYESFDIMPGSTDVKKRDTIKHFPSGYEVCVTNPPWLAKNSATRRGLPYPNTHYDNVYKLALEKCIDNCSYIAALVPESFIRSELFLERLDSFISLTGEFFDETEQPVGLAMFSKNNTEDVNIWQNNKFIGTLNEIAKFRPPFSDDKSIRFNDPDGNLGLIAVDSHESANIRFCPVKELENYEVKDHGRYITKLHTPFKIKIDDYNKVINEFRKKTYDVLLTSYRGLRKDGLYRRRLDWQLARDVVKYVA